MEGEAAEAAASWAESVGCALGEHRATSSRCSIATALPEYSDRLRVQVETKQVTSYWGFRCSGADWLHPEEAAYLVERGLLIVLHHSGDDTVPAEVVLTQAWSAVSWLWYRAFSLGLHAGLIIRRSPPDEDSKHSRRQADSLARQPSCHVFTKSSRSTFKKSDPGVPCARLEVFSYAGTGLYIEPLTPGHIVEHSTQVRKVAAVAGDGATLFFNLTPTEAPACQHQPAFK